MTPIVLLAAYATGIAMVRSIAPWGIAGHGMTIGLCFLLWVTLRHSRWAWIPFLALLLCAGFLSASLELLPPSVDNHISRFVSPSALILEGRVLTVEKRAKGGYRLRAEMRKVIKDQGSANVSGEILVYIKEGELSVRPGQIVRWRSPLRRPFLFGNPGEFNYPLYLAAHGIHVTAFITRAEDMVPLVNQEARKRTTVEDWRYSLAEHIERTVPPDAVGLVQSLLLGLRGQVSDEQRQRLSESGVAHLFAISGLHFGLLALLLYQVGKWFYTRSQRLILYCPPQRILPVLLIIPLTGYLFLTGNAWSTQRALIMVSCVALLFAKGRRTSPFALLATAALGLLLCNPLALFQAGFQLSFAGVAGILAWLPSWQQPHARSPKLVRWPLTLVLTTSAATLATAPATLWHFHQFAPAGLLTNLIAIPLIAWGAVPVGLISMAILSVSTPLADWGLVLSAKLVTFAISIVSSISQWSALAAIPLYLTTSTLVLLVGTALILLPYGKEKIHGLYRLVIMTTALITAWLTQPHVADFQVTALSVGQGDATLVSLANDRHFLVDGGGLPGSSIDPGEQLIAPALGRMGIDRLQGVILTHNHPDHSSGLTYILHHFPVETFYLAEEITNLAPPLREVLQTKQIPTQKISQGWTQLQTSDEQIFRLFTPAQTSRDINEHSIAVFAGHHNEGVLLTADLGEKGLQQLIHAGLPGRVSVLKLPHHGSRHSNPEAYLEWTDPSTAFVSAGRGNPYGFPHQQAIDACSKRQIPLFRTDQEGLLIFRLDKATGKLRRERLYN